MLTDMTRPLSTLRAAAAVAVGAFSVPPAVAVVEAVGQMVAAEVPNSRPLLPLFMGAPRMPLDAPLFVVLLMWGMLFGLLLFVVVSYLVIVGLPLLLLAQRIGLKSSLLFGACAGLPAAGVELLMHEPTLGDALWVVFLMSMACSAFHFTATWAPAGRAARPASSE